MRKRLKKKLRSCALCKPHKMGWDNRWKPKDAALLEEAEKEIAEANSLRPQTTDTAEKDTQFLELHLT